MIIEGTHKGLSLQKEPLFQKVCISAFSRDLTESALVEAGEFAVVFGALTVYRYGLRQH